MRVTLALGVAFAAMTMAAYAQPDHARVLAHHGGGHDFNMDADNDGWLTRAEAASGAERVFAELDSNSDGRLTPEDHPRMDEDFDVRIDGAHEGCTTTPEPEGASGERRVTVICRDGGEADGARHVERRVVRRGEGEAPRAPHEVRHDERNGAIIHGGPGEGTPAPMPPHPPMFMMMLANSEEADLNGDGAMSRDEFRAQHLRFFDASDANGDGRVRFDPPRHPGTAPMPPMPPAPPAPPRR